MRTTFLPALALLFGGVLHAQFYAPETDFHDISQRVFPVEAARVLAWQRHASEIVEITYQLENTASHESVWHIQWLGADHKPVREKTVRYPESLLAQGPKYFREVFGQLCGDDWVVRGTSKPEYLAAYWDGAKAADVSRTDAIDAAGRLIAEKPHLDQAVDAARLAGILAHGAMPSTATRLAIDSELLARAAAWLCIAEGLGHGTEDSPWVPILSLAGRDYPAQALWQHAAKRKEAERGDAERYWDFHFRRPSVKETFLFAAQAGNRQFAMPAMIFPHQFDLAWTGMLVDVADEIFGPQVTTRFFEYGPNISARGSVAGGNWAMRMPGLTVAAWMKTLAAYRPAALDYKGYEQLLKDAARVKPGESDAFTPFSALVNLGLDEGHGPLIPVAAVTARDLLGYGWEEIGLQFGYTYNHAAHKLGDNNSAEQISQFCFQNLKGVDIFFRQAKGTPKYPLTDIGRLQFNGSSLAQAALQKSPPDSWKNRPDILFRRCWLAFGPNIALESMARGHATDEEMGSMIARLRREGGPIAIANLINRDRNTQYPEVIDRLGLRASLLEDMPWALHAKLDAIAATFEKKDDPFAYAQMLEKLGWENGSFANCDKIFFQYVMGNADASAKRFYDEVQPYVTDRVSFSNSSGPTRYVLAWLERDEPGELRILQENGTYSAMDLLMEITHWLIHGDTKQALKLMNATKERYPTWKKQMDMMIEYAPLIPALNNPHDPAYGKALDSFPKDENWLFVRWALAVQAKMPTEDVVRLFAGPGDSENVFASAIRGDKERFEKLYNKREMHSLMAWVAAMHIHWKMTGAKPPANQPDLKPPGARSIQELVHEELQKQRH